MDFYSLVNAALCGFFGLAAIHYFVQWWLSRSERRLLVFALFCAASSLFCPTLILFANATTARHAQLALTLRVSIGLVGNALALRFLAEVGGHRNRLLTFAAGILLAAAALNLFVPLLGNVVALRPEPRLRSMPVLSGSHLWLLGAVFAILAAGYAGGVIIALKLWATDRAGSILVGLGSGANLVNFAVVAPLIDLAHVRARYVGTFPMAFFVLTMAMFLAREYSERGMRLAESERRFRTIFRESPVALVISERETGNILTANPAVLRLFGAGSLDQVIGKTSVELGIWDADDRRKRIAEALAESSGARGIAATIRQFDGETRAIEFWASLYEIDGKEHLLVSNVDVTDRQRAENELRESEQKFRQLFEGVRDVVFSLTPDGTITMLNPAFEKITGLPSSDWIGRSFLELIHPDDRARAAGELHDSLEQHPQDTPPLRIRASSGYLLGEINTAPRIEDGRVVSVLGIGRDVSDRVELEEQLRQAQKMEAVGRLAGGIAHDFNNILMAILGFAELLRIRLGEKNGNSRYISEIRKASERAAALTGQLLAFSRQQVLSLRVLNLNELLANLEEMTTRLIGEDISVRFRLDQSLDNIRADSNQLTQVVLNLAVNARDAMEGGGTLTVATSNIALDSPSIRPGLTIPSGAYVLLSVRDTGCGMDEETRARIFEPFFTTKEIGKGTGLGLSTVYGIVKQTGGVVEVESEPGAGTEFRIYLPSVREGISPQVSEREGPGRPVGNETILVVEDEPLIREMTSEYFESLGYRVLVAGSGSEALRVAAAAPNRIDLLITDIGLPDRKGWEVAEDLSRGDPALRVIILSGYAREGPRDWGPSLSTATFLQKPVSLNGLATTIRTMLDRPGEGAS